jgi:hypothetical protein
MTQLTRRAMIATLGGIGAASVLAGGCVLRHVWESFGSGMGRADPNDGMGASGYSATTSASPTSPPTT